MTDFNKLSRELIVSIRGKQTQTMMNKKLGFSHNKFAKWESGLDRIFWDDFVKICESNNFKLLDVLRNQTGYILQTLDSRLVVQHLIGGFSIAEISKSIKVSSATISRWLSTKSKVPLTAILSLLDRNGRIHGFVEQLLDGKNIPSFLRVNQERKSLREIFSMYPESSAVLCACELKEYQALKKHKEGFFSEIIGFSKKRENQIVEALLKSGILVMKNDKYEPSTYFSNMTWTSEESFYRDQKNKAFWLSCGAKSNLNEKFDNRKNTGGFDVYSTDINTAKKIKEEVSKCIGKIHRILEDCPNNESDILQVFQYQFINFPMDID